MPEETDLTIEQEDDTELIKKLRGLLRGKGEFAEENKNLKTQLLIAQAGLKDLSPRQLNALQNEMSSEENLDPDGVTAIAKELGFVQDPPPPPDPSQQQPQTPPPTNDGQPNPMLNDMNTLNNVQQSQVGTVSPNDVTSYNEEMRNTKTREELRGLIRAKGGKFGLKHEFDVS